MSESTENTTLHGWDAAALSIPIGRGLAAAAAELDGRQGSELRELARRIEQGEALATIFADEAGASGRFAAAAVKAGMASDQFGDVLLEITEFLHRRWLLRQSLRRCWAYPAGLLVFSIAILIIVLVYFVPITFELSRIDSGFGWDSPSVDLAGTRVLTPLGLAILAYGVFLIVVRALLGPIRWQTYVALMPILGPIVSSSGAWEFAEKLRMLISRGVPLEDGLDIVGDDMRDANWKDVCHLLANGHRGGVSLGDQLRDTTRVPATLSSAIAWGESHDRLAASLEMAAEIFRARVMLYVELLTRVLPPLTYAAVAAIALTSAANVLIPMKQLVEMLVTF